MTKEEIKAAAYAYANKERDEDKAEGYNVHDLRYSDLKYAFVAGAEWAQSQLVHEPNPQEGGITAEELAHQIHGYNHAVDRAAEWMQSADIKWGASRRELVDEFLKHMQKL